MIFEEFASLWMICDTNFTLITAVVLTTILPCQFLQPFFLSSVYLHIVNFSKEYFVCVDQAVCRPGSSGWCADLVNSFQKDIQPEQAIAKNRE